jgi:hypothetical protein
MIYPRTSYELSQTGRTRSQDCMKGGEGEALVIVQKIGDRTDTRLSNQHDPPQICPRDRGMPTPWAPRPSPRLFHYDTITQRFTKGAVLVLVVLMNKMLTSRGVEKYRTAPSTLVSPVPTSSSMSHSSEVPLSETPLDYACRVQ